MWTVIEDWRTNVEQCKTMTKVSKATNEERERE